MIDLLPLILAGAGIALGGFLKGATGAGAPVVGVPVLAIIYDVQTAVAVFSVLNLISNIWHGWAYRAARGRRAFVWSFALAGGVGVAIGSVILARLATETLMGLLGAIVLVYVGLRLARPDLALARAAGERFASLAGFSGGILQGAGGISAPISVTYLNAMHLSRGEFIATISVYFATMSLFQIPTLASLGIMTAERLLLAVAVAVPLFAAIPAGEWAAKRLSKAAFDRIVLALLAVIALRLIQGALSA